MAHFYLSEDLPSAAVGDTVALTGSEARHAVAVSRARVGEPITVGDGAGLVLSGTVTSAASDRLELMVGVAVRSPIPSPSIWLAQALAKGDRDEAAVQAATELGVDGVIPWAAQRSIVRWEGSKARKGQERWAAIVREATKQSVRPWLPEVSPVQTTAQLAGAAGGAGASGSVAPGLRMLVLDPEADTRLTSIRPDERDILVVVGPEGGIAPDEFRRLEAAGATRVRLGSTVLRTSTAGPAAIAVLSTALGRW